MRADRRGLAGVRPLWLQTVPRLFVHSMNAPEWTPGGAAADEPPHERAQLQSSCADCPLTFIASIAPPSIFVSSLRALVPSGQKSDA